jgi:glycosyltransferase involved in cell wall biosynthesis
VYEVNGLPSLELPALYPDIPPSTCAKLRDAEAFCWTTADRIITPSQTLRQNLIALGAPAEKICVIPNGADLSGPSAHPHEAPECYLIYCGALQPWQGVDVLLRAFTRLADLTDVFLVLCVAATPRRTKIYQKLADKLGIAERVRWYVQLPHQELAAWLAHARLAVAPLTECPRNLEQGCCPLKILEAMAAGIPVVASDIPAVRELITDGQHGRLVRPDRPAELARAIRILLEYPNHAQALGVAARQRLAQYFTWAQATQRLQHLYHSLCPEIPLLTSHASAAVGG